MIEKAPSGCSIFRFPSSSLVPSVKDGPEDIERRQGPGTAEEPIIVDEFPSPALSRGEPEHSTPQQARSAGTSTHTLFSPDQMQSDYVPIPLLALHYRPIPAFEERLEGLWE